MRRYLLAGLMSAAMPLAAAPIATPVKDITDPKSVTSAANPAAKPVPLGDLAGVRAAFGAVWAPDGRSLVISTNITGRFNLWRVDTDQSFPTQLTLSDDVQTPDLVTPDGDVLFNEDDGGDELYDLYSVPLRGGAVVNLTNSPDYAESDPRLSPDSGRIALARRAKTGAAVDLALLDRKTGAVRPLTAEKDPSRTWKPAGWSADGRTLFATRGSITGNQAAIYRIDVASGRATPLTREKAGVYVSAEGVSPDGGRLAINSNEATGQMRAGLLEVATKATRWLKPTAWEQFAWPFSPDGKSFIAQTNADGRSSLSIVDVATLTEKPLAFPPGVTAPANGTAPWRPGGGLLVNHDSGSSPFDYWLHDPATGGSKRVTRLAVASLDPATLPKTAIIAYRAPDGTPISAVLTIPYNLQRDGSNPAVVIPHGGPTGQSQDFFSRQATALASRGYLVLQPNFRGSTGYGRAFQEANVKDLGGGDLDDVVAGAKFLVDTGYVNPKRIGIMGGSYGGFMTLMALGKRPDVFAAGVNQFGIINWYTMWENSVGGLREYQRALVGDPVKDKAAYDRQSPMTYARNIRAPLLVLQGENDVRVPKGQSAEVVELLKGQGGTVEAVYYPGEGHGFAKLENQQDARARAIAWFDKYLKAPQ